MKINIIKFAIIFAFFFTSCNQCEKKKNCLLEPEATSSFYVLRGKVKSVKYSTYEAIDKFGEILKGKPLDRGYLSNSFTVFNELGFLKTLEYYDTLYLPYHKVEVEFDEKKCPKLRKTSENEKLLTVDRYFNNMEDLLLEVKTYDSSSILTSTSKIRYNIDGNSIAIYAYEANGQLTMRDTIEYDLNKKRKKSTTFNNKNETTNYTIYNNNVQNNSFTYTTYDPKEPTLNYEITIKNNEKGDNIEWSNYKKGFVWTCEYVYEKENWIKRTEYLNGKVHSITERILEYY